MITGQLVAGITALLLSGTSAQASLFTGTWVADLDTQRGLPTDVYLVRDGTYECLSCIPPRRYRADGRLRLVDRNVSEGVTILNGRTISTRIVQPDLARTTRMQVSPDGRAAKYVSVDQRRGIAGPLRTEYLARRVANGPPGSHRVSGTWQGVRYVSVPLQLRTTNLGESQDVLSYRTGTGYSYTAKLGGPAVAIAGPYDGSISVSVRKLDLNRLEETRRRAGVGIEVRTYTVTADGKAMEIATTNLATNTTFRITARRQIPR